MEFRFSISAAATAAAKSLQSCPTLCNPIDGSSLGSVPGILQARTLEWGAIALGHEYGVFKLYGHLPFP